MSAEEERLYGLMEIAERQQAAVQAALDGLAAAGEALERERQRLAREVAALGPGTREAVKLAVAESLAGATSEVAAAVKTTTEPVLAQLKGVKVAAAQAEAALHRVASWASWRLLGWLMALITALVLLGWLTSNGLIWWDTRTLNRLQDQITTLRAHHDAWVKAGMLDQLTYCDPGHRPCVAVNEGAGSFALPGGPDDLRVLKGY